MNRPKYVLPIGIGFLLLLFSIMFGIASAQGGSACDHDPFCEKYDNPGNSGVKDAPPEAESVWKFCIKAGEPTICYEETTNDGCYDVVWLSPTRISWQKIGTGRDCKDVSHVQLWWVAGEEPTATPTVPTDPTATPTVPVDPTPTVSTNPTATPTVPTDPTPTVPTNPTATPTVPVIPTPTVPTNQVYSASWKANFLKTGDHTPVPGVIVLTGYGIQGGWSWHSMDANWDNSYANTYVPIVLTTQATAVEMYFWPYGVKEWAVQLYFHESNTWDGNIWFGTIGEGDIKSLEVGFPSTWSAPAEPAWWSSIWWNPSIPESHFWTWASYHQANNWPPQ